MGIIEAGTFRANRIVNCLLPSEKDLKKKAKEHGITWLIKILTRLIKLYDKCMLIGSTHAGVTGSSKLKRFDSKTKTSIE